MKRMWSSNLGFVVAVLAMTTIMMKNDLLVAAKPSVDAKIREDTDLSQFYQLLESNPIANSTLMHRHVTVFAPTNQAFQRYHGSTENNLVLYHISNQPFRTEQFGQSLTSELEGNPPLWVTRRPGAHGREEIFINNARIIEGSNYESPFGTNENDRKIQVLHKISEVLEPVQARGHELIYNPDAMQFLNKSETLNLGRHRIRTFHHRVRMVEKDNVFSAEGKYTFFIPIDDGFKPSHRASKIDKQVIDGHVIPNHVLFTAPTPSNKPYETLAFGDNLKVTITFSTEHTDKGVDKYYIKSDTLMGDSQHPSASVLAEIVKANIPVKNGVIHLIQNPLMVVDTTVQEFIQSWKDKEDGPLYKFYEVIRDQGDEFMRQASRYSNITLFAPRNAAWDEPGVKQILQDKKRVKELLNLHYVRDYLPLEVIERRTTRQVPTAQPRTSLYFNVLEGPSGNHTVTVEGGGVNATIITANIGATNGIIHIIDRVLGVPYTTMLDKLRTDPTLNSTYHLGMRHDFNSLLGNEKERYTFFAPQDRAWQHLQVMQPSLHKKMFMADFAYHVRQILERHLVVGRALTMKKLVELDRNDTLHLKTMRDKLTISVKEVGDNYIIEWKGKKIRVVRPDVACTNGIIHVIDDAMLRESDVHVTGSGAASLIVPNIITFLIVKWLL